MSDTKSILDSKTIQKFIPHRYPFVLVDRVLEYGPEYVKAIKNVTANEEFFVGHFPDNPVMPGVLIVEAMAQSCCFLVYDEFSAGDHKLEVFFMGIDRVRFRKVVAPGDQLILEAKLTKKKRDFWWCDVTAKVDGEIACEASLSALLRVT